MGDQIRIPEVNSTVQPASPGNDNMAAYRNGTASDNDKKGFTLGPTDFEIIGGELLVAGGGLIAFQKIDSIGGDINNISQTLTKDLNGAESLIQADFGKAATGLQGALTNTTGVLQADFTKATTLLQGDFTKATALATQGVGVIHSDLTNIANAAAKPQVETTINDTTINKTVDKTTNNTVDNKKDIIIERKPGEKPPTPAPHPPGQKVCTTDAHPKAPDGYEKLGTAHPKGTISHPGISQEVPKVTPHTAAAIHPHDFRTAIFAPASVTPYASVAGLKGLAAGAHGKATPNVPGHATLRTAPHMAPRIAPHVTVARMPHMGARLH